MLTILGLTSYVYCGHSVYCGRWDLGHSQGIIIVINVSSQNYI